jgi:NAD+ diphosphatase
VDGQSRFDLHGFGKPTSGSLPDRAVYLGHDAEGPWFALRTEVEQPDAVLNSADLDPVQSRVMMASVAALNWQDTARHCEWCGGTMETRIGGFSAVCADCGRESFPRMDPAAIVGVLNDDDELFLARQPTWPPKFYSILAGFVEAGESCENAVVREVYEESQLQIVKLRYFGSQPWPFPRSLMLGFVALGKGVGAVDGEELESGSWVSREHCEAKVATGELILPGPASIARRIVDAWRSGEVGAADFV